MASDAASIVSEGPVQPMKPLGLPDALSVLAHGLAKGSANSADEIADLNKSLLALRVAELKSIAQHLNVRLTGASKKFEIVERLMAMSLIDAMRKDGESETARLTYITDSVRTRLSDLPRFAEVKDWSKDFCTSILKFHFMDIFTYLVYGRNKTFDMEAMKAFRSLKGYVFFRDQYVRNVWTKHFPCEQADGVDITYIRGYVHHSLSCDPSLVVFAALNSQTGEVYSAQCNCVAG